MSGIARTASEFVPMESSDEVSIRLANYAALHTLINAEGALIWSRYNTMLTVNAVFSALLGSIVAKDTLTGPSAIIAMIGSSLGIYIAVLWYGLHTRGWDLQRAWIEAAKKQDWGTNREPYSIYEDWNTSRPKKDSSNRYAISVIWMFGIIYYFALLAFVARASVYIVEYFTSGQFL